MTDSKHAHLKRQEFKRKELKLQEFLPYRLFVLASRISRSLAQHYETKFGISRPEWRVLAVLGEQPELSAAEVAERSAMDKVAVSRAVNRLLVAKLVVRDLDTLDKRRSTLKLSASGEARYHEIVPIAVAYEQKILDQLHPGERELLCGLLEKLDRLNFDF